MTAKKAKNEVALVEANPREALKLLEAKLKSLEHISDSNYITPGTIDGVGDIKTMMNLQDLIKAYGALMMNEKCYNESAEALKLTTYPQFQVKGHPISDWKKDILLRYNIINHEETLKKLNYFKDKWSKFLSEEDQKQDLLDEMGEFFNV